MTKRVLLAGLLGLSLASAQGYAAVARSSGEPARINDITVNPLGLAFGLGNLSYERSVNMSQSWLVGGNFGGYGVADNKLAIFGLTAAYRWWSSDVRRMDGWFVGPELKYEGVTWTYTVAGSNYSANGGYIGGGVQGGYQWIFNGGFTLNLGLNYDYLAGSISSNVSGAPTINFGGAGAGANLGLGYAF